MKASKTITALAGLGALAVVLTGAAFWREIVCAVYPEALLWGKWECKAPTGDQADSLFDIAYSFEFKESGEIVLGHSIRPIQVRNAAIAPNIVRNFSQIQSRYKKYKVQRKKILLNDEAGNVVLTWNFWFEGVDTLVVEDVTEGQMKLRRLPPED